MIRCKLPSPFDNGYSDIIMDPQNFLVQQPSTAKKGFFDKIVSTATTYAAKATDITKNFVDNRKLVLCVYCTSC